MLSIAYLCLALLSGALASPPQTGTVFQIDPGMGACGWTNTSTQAVGSVSATTFKTFPGATANPNKNPICHHSLVVQVGDKNVTVEVVDYFKETRHAHANDVGIPVMQFAKLDPDLDDGIIENATWYII
ncbi:hypothetical protein C8R43DRAFT_1231834 [Mycena crocata]|nr:hypothetical protein C8R43DRAFT_1231834 [Mycena crocata]